MEVTIIRDKKYSKSYQNNTILNFSKITSTSKLARGKTYV